MTLIPDSLRTNVYQPWSAGNPPQPLGGEQVHLFLSGDDGTVYHKWWDGSKWNGWENLGHP